MCCPIQLALNGTTHAEAAPVSCGPERETIGVGWVQTQERRYMVRERVASDRTRAACVALSSRIQCHAEPPYNGMSVCHGRVRRVRGKSRCYPFLRARYLT